MNEIRDFSILELENFLEGINEKKFRAKQIFKWIHTGITDFDEMTDLSKNLRQRLKTYFYIENMSIETKAASKDGTVKYLLKLLDGNLIECVLMRYEYGNSICLSTQAGCSMGCSFCASTIGGKVRNLTAGEMLGQILTIMKDQNIKINNIVLMGTGEPLDNFENVIKFLNIVNDPNGINIGMRHITLSTCGLVPEIKRLAELKLQITLAISLHAPNDDIRKNIMPVAKKYGLDELLDACRYYTEMTNRRITFEYALMQGINDSVENAYELARRLDGILCHVNLIPINPIMEREYEKPNKFRIEQFKDVLTSSGINATIRRELGSDIDAACGQLRRRHM
ncbi:putative dual-specificity RNA methyltransferase RlmN [Caloramator mitchellensis]|uniref:Probable dual-specificity RNA methyltransferase RlmN n=1 Tax=Caloramator mitchellensis TaxID=908809 RepID=A0A0R3JTR6_CALMK|nr:23S rRNA (adenine(2503)-C(2))-methyltransferase RlmN [Caloramator mitchellensis]KRQ86928.1 putative dual-specificity RNA methyltransferase RlmN [Caloramator mitchellensis]